MKSKTLFSTKVSLKNSFDHSLHFKSNRHSTFNPIIFLSKRVVIPPERCHYLYRKVSSFIKEGTSNGKASLSLLKDAFIPMERRRYLYQKGSLFLPGEIFVLTERVSLVSGFFFYPVQFYRRERQGKKPSLSIVQIKTIKPLLLLKFCDNLDVF